MPVVAGMMPFFRDPGAKGSDSPVAAVALLSSTLFFLRWGGSTGAFPPH
jgi:hypothetical protein